MMLMLMLVKYYLEIKLKMAAKASRRVYRCDPGMRVYLLIYEMLLLGG